MAYGTIIVKEKLSPTFNLGDYVQSLAAMQFLPKDIDPILLERDNISDSPKDGETIKVIMNGWWMANPQKFPPSNSILPFYRSFHLRPKIEKSFFTKETIDHLKKYQPIGCRDENTSDMMSSHGIKAYFSGCLTLTLGQTYKYQSQETSPVYIVDPFVGKFASKDVYFSLLVILRCIFIVLFRLRLLCKVKNRIQETCPFARRGYDLWLYTTKICAIYSEAIGKDVLMNAIYRTHIIHSKLCNCHKDRIELAQHFLNDYSKARFVITSRIHCGLPCLGIGTPVILAVSPPMVKSGRMGGIKELFRTAIIRNGKCFLNKNDFNTQCIHYNFHFDNYNRYKLYADKLISDCKCFIQQ